MENPNEVKKEIRIGRFTFGITLILFGISVLIQLFFRLDVLRYILMLWPVIFIILGIETIVLTSKKDAKIKYDIAGIFFTGIILFSGILMSFVSLMLNRVLYEDTVKEAIIEEAVSSYSRDTLAGTIEICNLGNAKVEVQVIEYDGNESYSTINTRGVYDKEKANNLFLALSNKYDIDRYITLQGMGEEHSKYVIEEVPEYITGVKIRVFTNNKDNISLRGENIVLE